MREYPPDLQRDLINRLRRIEGQVRGVQRMIEEERDCREVLQQLMAVRSAVHQTSLRLVRHFAAECLQDPHRAPDQVVGDLMDILVKMPY
jgi:DNA-binding FrmR family transcriptional regulator